jgi:peptidoglycan/LPS O-acetylase OafA/YrhL
VAVENITSDTPQKIRQNHWRADIQGLRAIAVVLVLVWHAGVSILPGGFIGVDVFFVVSGFLMTQILHREVIQTGKVRISNFYARRFRRLIPASALVLAVTAMCTYLFLPATRWFSTGIDTVSAGLYVVNWTLAAQSVDYLAQDYAPSPIQHFWSLSVEEQYYLVWPLLVGIVALVVLRFRLRIGLDRVLLLLLAGIFVVSLVWSIRMSSTNPGPAYFVTTTRIWELALGGIVAITSPFWTRLRPSLATALGWFGLLTIVVTAVLLQTSVPFPGAVALLPTLGTAVVLGVGYNQLRHGPVMVLRGQIMQWIGGLSYSLYLWHWPFLVIGGYLVTGGGLRNLSPLMGLMLVCISFLPAWVATRWIEAPFHKNAYFTKSIRHSFGVGLGGIAIAVVAGLGLMAAGHFAEDSVAESKYTSQSGGTDFGAQVLPDNPQDGAPASISISPSPTAARNDNPPVYANGCHQPASSVKPVACELGVPDGKLTVALVGDSHAAHWVDAMDYVAKQRGWRLLSYTKSSCPLLDATVINRGVPAAKCAEWNSRVMEDLEKLHPAAVFVSNIDYAIAGASDSKAAMVEGMARQWKQLDSMGSDVFVLRDTPSSRFDPPDCLAGHEDAPEKCSTDRDDAFGERGRTQIEAVKLVPSAKLIDATPWICPSDPCEPVIGDVLVYRDRTHMTATYSRSLGPRLLTLIPPLPTQ